MIILAGTFRFDPSQGDAARRALTDIVVATRGEAGCVVFTFGPDLIEPDLVNVYEVWRDRAALEAHRASPHMAAWRARHAEIGMRERKLTLFEVSHHEAVA